MYSVFDSFLATDTWSKNHPNDEERFYLCLQEVVRESDFNADNMGEYFRTVKNISRTDENQYFSNSIDDLVAKAWAVSDYIKFTGE